MEDEEAVEKVAAAKAVDTAEAEKAMGMWAEWRAAETKVSVNLDVVEARAEEAKGEDLEVARE